MKRTLTDREAEALGEDRRDGHDMPAEVADYEAGRWADDYWGEQPVSADRTWPVAGPCPFLTCLETGPHEHAICPDCDAVRYGNPFFCPTCCAVLNAERAANGLELLPTPQGEDR